MTTLEWRLYEAGYCTHPELATRRGASLTPCQFPALVALLRHPEHGYLLFDTGYSVHFLAATTPFPERLYRWATPVHLQPAQSLAAQLKVDGIDPSEIGWVVISHMHGDHVGGLADFPEARMACAREAWQDLHTRSRFGALRKGLLPRLLDAREAANLRWFEDCERMSLEAPFDGFDDAYDLFGDGSALLVALPGHAAGHFGLLFHDAHGPVFLIADASWSSQSIRDNTPPPVLVTAWLGDTDAYRATLAKLHVLQCSAPHVRIVPAHCREWRPRVEAAP
ncbi:MBL fold metallo-hydrolase [Thermomonas sp.]|uniref:MBL fold metallo-hydrolase n=1 Tax=Thermomonas sp. TaxID=1971895 RepID=UPI002489888E|nr:MBL fold metallo-hydrolase [Thermomonas sp.]MDI1252743.1 MBL fold metallo-hydrolase [Thermomonas sp.]